MSDQALSWIDEVVSRHGTQDGPDRVRVPQSQAALARETNRSAGTINYYLRSLRPAVERDRGALVIDIAALAERRSERDLRRTRVVTAISDRFSQLTADGTSVDAEGSRRPPTLRAMAESAGRSPSTLQRQLTKLERDGYLSRGPEGLSVLPAPSDNVTPPLPASPDLLGLLTQTISTLTEVTAQLTAVATQLVSHVTTREEEPANPRTCATEFADNPRKTARKFADFVGTENTQTSSEQEKESKLLSFSSKKSAKNGAQVRGFADFAGSRLSRDQIKQAVKPLEDLCKKAAGVAIDELDDSGCRMLEPLTLEQLQAGVQNAIGRFRSGKASSPLGLLCDRARSDDKGFFTPRAASSRARPAESEVEATEVDVAAEDAVSAMSPADLDVLDQEITAALSPAAFDRLRQSPHQLASYRRHAWRQRQQRRLQEVRDGASSA